LIYMSRGVRKRLRRAITSERQYVVEQRDLAAPEDKSGYDAQIADFDSLLKEVEECPTGRLVPDDWETPNGTDGATPAERIAIAIDYYGILETMPGRPAAVEEVVAD
jgi:hypothetical protein